MNPVIDELNLKFKRVFGTPDGQDVLHAICRFGHLMRSTYSNSDVSENNLIYREGERNVVMYILNRMHAVPFKVIEEIYKMDRGDI